MCVVKQLVVIGQTVSLNPLSCLCKLSVLVESGRSLPDAINLNHVTLISSESIQNDY